MSTHEPGCDVQPWEERHEIWDDGTHRYCGVCGALLALWPEDSDDGWGEVA